MYLATPANAIDLLCKPGALSVIHAIGLIRGRLAPSGAGTLLVCPPILWAKLFPKDENRHRMEFVSGLGHGRPGKGKKLAPQPGRFAAYLYGLIFMNGGAEEIGTRLLLVDELGLFRASLARFLASEPGLEVVECGSCREALDLLRNSHADTILLDFEIGGEHGDDFIAAALSAGFQGHFLILAGSPDVRKSALMLKAGASGIFLKSEPPERLLKAIRVVAEGGMWVDQRVIQPLAAHLINQCPPLPGLEPMGKPLEERERSVLLGVVRGLTNRKIGINLGMSESQIKNIIQRLFSKSGVNTRSQLVRLALEGWLGTPDEVMKAGPPESASGCTLVHNQPIV